MNILILLVIWLVIPLAIITNAVLSVRHLRKQRLHDLILYRFCAVRDAIALKVLSEELTEDSEIFRFFYVFNAQLIHGHRHAGICFNDIGRRVVGHVFSSRPKRPMEAKTKRLIRQLKHASPEIKAIADAWTEGCAAMLHEAASGMLVERLIWKMRNTGSDFYRWVSKQFYIPESQRATATLISVLSAATGRRPTNLTVGQLAPAF